MKKLIEKNLIYQRDDVEMKMMMIMTKIDAARIQTVPMINGVMMQHWA